MKNITFQKKLPIKLANKKLITKLPYIGKQYKVSFDLLITKFDTTEYQSVLRLTLGGNIEAYGDRAPAVWVHKDKYLHVSSFINGNKNLWYNVENTKSQKFAPVKVFAGDNFYKAPEGN